MSDSINGGVMPAIEAKPSRRLFLAAGSAGAVFATVKSVAASQAAPVISGDIREAIDKHKALQAIVDATSSEDEDTFDAAIDAESAALWALAGTECANEADFLAKLFHILDWERRLQGGWYSYDTNFGQLAFAVRVHRWQKLENGSEFDDWTKPLPNAAAVIASEEA